MYSNMKLKTESPDFKISPYLTHRFRDLYHLFSIEQHTDIHRHHSTDSLKNLLVTLCLTLITLPFLLADVIADDSVPQTAISSCEPTYDGQTLVIPCIKVDKEKASFYYGATLQNSPDNDSQLKLIAITEIDGLSISTSNCLSSYSIETGQLVIPCGFKTTQILYATDDFSSPTAFSTFILSERSPRAATASPPRTPPFNETGSWNPSGGQDIYSINNPAYPFTTSGGRVSITLTSSVDNYLYLLDSNNKIIAFNDDSVGTNAKIETTLLAGSYIVVAATLKKGEKGNFTLSGVILTGTNPDPIFNAPFTVTGSWITSCGTNPYCSTHKRYKFTTFNEGTIIIDLSSTPDNYLFLYDSNNKLIASNDDTVGKNARIKIKLSAGTYTIVATTARVGERGSFTLSANIIRLIPSIPFTDLGFWSSSGGMNPNSYGNPHYSFTTKGGPIAVDLYPSSNGGATTPSGYLYLLDANDKVITTSIGTYGQSGGTANGHSSIFTSLPPGTFTIVVATSGTGERSNFILTVQTSQTPNPRSVPFTETGSWNSSNLTRRYSFSVTGVVRPVSITLTSYGNYYYGSTSNHSLRLLDAGGNVIANTNGGSFLSINRTLPTGNYTIEITFSYGSSWQSGNFTLSAN